MKIKRRVNEPKYTDSVLWIHKKFNQNDIDLEIHLKKTTNGHLRQPANQTWYEEDAILAPQTNA